MVLLQLLFITSDYIKPVKHWFTKSVHPTASMIEIEAWQICREVGLTFSTLPTQPILHRFSLILGFPHRVYLARIPVVIGRTVLCERLLRSEKPVHLCEDTSITAEELRMKRSSEEVSAIIDTYVECFIIVVV